MLYNGVLAFFLDYRFSVLYEVSDLAASTLAPGAPLVVHCLGNLVRAGVAEAPILRLAA
jgi:hypothetical protein